MALVHAYNDKFENVCNSWESPTVIVSDGAYGISGFEGDCNRPADLPAWYEPHIALWSSMSSSQTTLWFWNTEIGWAHVHPVLEKYGWIYVHANVWDKGKSHIAGNVNTKTIRHFPVATELCVQYVRSDVYLLNDINVGSESFQSWLRSEWKRAGLTLKESNLACGVKNAASRKYLTADHRWYPPPPEMFAKLSEYANKHGHPHGKPYFVMGDEFINASKYKRLRATFNCPYGLYNVWHENPVRGTERIKDGDGRYLHPNQKPISLMELIIESSSNINDVVWDVYGGVLTGAVACHNLERACYTSEPDKLYYQSGLKRLYN